MFLHRFLLITWHLIGVSADTPVSGRFGECIVLPCDGTAAVGNSGDQIDILWRHSSGNVLVFSHETIYPGHGFEHRVNISKEGVSQGNFSMRLCSTTFSDERLYGCYYRRKDSHVTILGVVPLTITAHRDTVIWQPGICLSLPLFTGEPVEVLFDPAGAGDSTPVCSVQNSTASCVPQYRDRVSVWDGSLMLLSLTPADQGNYTVRDLQGNTISTVTLTVRDEELGKTKQRDQRISRGRRAVGDKCPPANDPPRHWSPVGMIAGVTGAAGVILVILGVRVWLRRSRIVIRMRRTKTTIRNEENCQLTRTDDAQSNSSA